MRTGKIARLPQTIREQLNRRLDNGDVGRTILKWLNDLPETKQKMAELFEAKPITQQNLSEWRLGGYQDWLDHQERIEWFDRLTEQDAEIEKHDASPDTFEAFGRFIIVEIGHAFAKMQQIKNPDARFARLEHLTDKFTKLQNAYNWSRHVELSWRKHKDHLKSQGWQIDETEPDRRSPDRPVSEPLNPQTELRPDQLSNSPLPNSLTSSAPRPEIPNVPPETAPPVTRPSPLAPPPDSGLPPREAEFPEIPTNTTPTPTPGDSPVASAYPQPETPNPKPEPVPLDTRHPSPGPDRGLRTVDSALAKSPHISPAPMRGRRFQCIEG